MACRIALRTVFLTEQRLPLSFIHSNFSSFRPVTKISKSNPSCGCRTSANSKSYQFSRYCSNKGDSSPSADDSEQGPPQEAVLKAISEVSKAEGDQKVNSYPTVRGFTAIGTGGNDFVQAMVVAVESVLQMPIPEGQVKRKISSGGKYVSVNIGPVQVISSEQVQAVYNAMRQDDRMKYFL
ncbi:hypothetical protein AAHA92_07531 [Salvia divinorum]|uniref:Uncharacterized protein n=1 Tax=Salvia divinorum TaxID=28513 RepID=A0ABD1IBX3_SALDI